jgi:putative ABC transport system substrate-binding protein
LDRRGALAAITCLLPLRAVAQSKVYRVGFLGAGRPTSYAYRIDALKQGLRERGYVEGLNLVMEYRWAEGDYERLPGLAEDLVRSKVDVVVTHSTPGARAAKQATSTTPIVITDISDIVATGLVQSLAKPGGNVTGSTLLAAELNAKRFEILREVLPRARRFALLVNSANPAQQLMADAVVKAASPSKAEISQFLVAHTADFGAAFQAMARDRVDAVMVLEDPVFSINRERLASLALFQRLPLVGFAEFGESGALIEYGVDFRDLYRRAASFVDRILKGAKPSDLPIEQAEKFDLVVNLVTAEALGIKVPQSVLVRAERLIR